MRRKANIHVGVDKIYFLKINLSTSRAEEGEKFLVPKRLPFGPINYLHKGRRLAYSSNFSYFVFIYATNISKYPNFEKNVSPPLTSTEKGRSNLSFGDHRSKTIQIIPFQLLINCKLFYGEEGGNENQITC